MTLVPIIYTSLIIFSVLLFTVIIISYLSYRLKSKDRKRLPSERIETANSIIISKPSALNIPKLSQKPVLIHAYNNAKPKYSDQVILQERKVRKENLSLIQAVDRKDFSYKNRNEESKHRQHNERINLRKTRLEIMNESNSFRKTTEYNHELNRQNYDRDKMVEANLFNYYDNSTESDFAVMDTSLLRQAQ